MTVLGRMTTDNGAYNICMPIRNGKTVWEITESCRTGSPIVVRNQKYKERILNLADELGFKIPEPVTLTELYGLKATVHVIDDFDLQGG